MYIYMVQAALSWRETTSTATACAHTRTHKLARTCPRSGAVLPGVTRPWKTAEKTASLWQPVPQAIVDGQLTINIEIPAALITI